MDTSGFMHISIVISNQSAWEVNGEIKTKIKPWSSYFYLQLGLYWTECLIDYTKYPCYVKILINKVYI